MGYELKTRDDGTVDLVEIIPVVIANFRDLAHAERYYGILAETGAAKPVASSRAAELNLPKAEPVPEARSSSGKTAAKLMVKVQPAEPKAEPEERPEWATPGDADWEQAFQALANGGDMKKIAAALNVNVYKLRAKYGAWCRNQKKPDPAPSPETGMETCRLCERAFKPTAESDGRCARCSKDG
ncbi:hypothetical protein [Salipiger abyssi]|uniref:Uncharacterized protein n=1 Tax=Salipiger abyssi TaxID=1250539 RepID=A0A1P8UXL7_9RHOB|nr:hypothetical protein [Salipiger abyssi]ALF02125.1 hypothetical protein vBPeaSP1_034 [Pelagibaca phage vB_PeaS-P1]APZ54140.1 hypothetical protein Ga0080574_TMP3806 [Salipiger abyssi]